MQGLPYQSGAHYARVSCYLPAATKTGKATLTVQVLGAKGTPLSRGSQFSMPVSLHTGQWSTTVLPLDLPINEKAVQLRFMVTLDSFAPDEKLYLDDAGIYRINP